MKKFKFKYIIISLLIIFLLLIFLCFGKMQEIKIEDDNDISTILIIKGEIVGAGYSVKQPIDAEINDILAGSPSAMKHIMENIVGKGYSNVEVIEKIKDYMNSKNGRLVSVEDKGYSFIGLKWFIHKLNCK